jgi:phosphohistidine phosphatase
MAPTIQLAETVSTGQPMGLETWMRRVLERADKVAEHWQADDIHDLRVALRRCRAMAEALSQVNPDPLWRKMKKSTRDVFRALGQLHDTQMERVWLKKLWPVRQPLRAKLLRGFTERERAQRKDAQKALGRFDRKSWKKWSRKAGRQANFFPVGSIVFQRLASTELDGCAALFERARRRPSAIAWHRARIALKHFRYLSENFLPKHYEPMAPTVRRLQDLLGEVHDMDVLRADVRKMKARRGPAALAVDMEGLQKEKAVRLAEVAARITGPQSVLAEWRAILSPVRLLALAPFVERRTA